MLSKSRASRSRFPAPRRNRWNDNIRAQPRTEPNGTDFPIRRASAASVALRRAVPCGNGSPRGFSSDRPGEFGERGREAAMRTCLYAEFVVAASDVLHQGMTAHDHAC
jgi:hypothetical protein